MRALFTNGNATEITEIKLKGKYGFVEYAQKMDAAEFVPKLRQSPSVP